jgi:stage II sporulation protein D
MPLHRVTRAVLAAAGVLALAGGTATPARADDAVVPTDGKVIITGHGWGHGRGMSQYGAYGAAKQGLTAAQILAFYYSGTTLGTLANDTMRVWISSDTDGKLHFRPDSGLAVSDSAGTTVKLPTTKKYTKWRIARSGSTRVLAYRSTSGKYVTYKTKLSPTRSWQVKNAKTGTVRLAMPDLSTRTYPGSLALNFSGTSAITVNYVKVETYLRSVVPAEMPAGWGSATNGGYEAVKAQSIAARTYAARVRAAKPTGSAYDICDSSSCQVYKPLGYRSAISDSAIKDTAGSVVLFNGQLALTEFTSSNGGWSASNPSLPYLAAHADPYEAFSGNPYATWTKTLTTAQLQAAYPAIGTFSSIQVSARTGLGPYAGAGRATTILVVGDKGTVSVTGASFKSRFSLKETLFALSLTPAANPAAVTKKS